MFRSINNLDNNDVVSIETKALYNGNSFISVQTSSGSYYYSFSYYAYVFIKVHITNSNADLFRDGHFQLFLNSFSAGTVIKVYKLTSHLTDLGNNPSALLSCLTQSIDYLIDEVVISNQNLNFVTLDINQLLKEYAPQYEINNSFVFAIKIESTVSPSNPGYLLYPPNYLSIQMSVFNFKGLNSFNEFQNYSCSGSDKAYLNTKTGELTHNVSLFASRGKKMPILSSLIYNPNNQSSYFYFKYIFNCEYRLVLNSGHFLLIAPNAFETFYSKINTTSSDIESTLLNLGILHRSNHSNDDIYYSEENASYLYVSSNDSLVYLYDKDDNELIFELFNNTYRLKKMTNQNGNYLAYTYNLNNKIYEINSSDGDIARFIYSTSNMLLEILFVYEKRKILFQQTNNSLTLSLYNFEEPPSTVLIKRITLSFSGEKLSAITQFDKDNNQVNRLLLFWNQSNQIIEIKKYGPSNVMATDSFTFHYFDDYTKITNINTKSSYHYFDTYGRNRLIVDDDGNTITNNYQEIINGRVNNLSETREELNSSRSLIENHSFEFFDGDTPVGWSKSGTYTSIEQCNGDCLFGSSSLLLAISYGQSLSLCQHLNFVPEDTNYLFSVFAKTINNGSLSIRIDITDNGITMSHYINLSNLDNKWNQYFCNESITISSTVTSVDVYITISNYVSNEIYNVYLDDISFSNRGQNIRYNLFKNGYLESIDSATDLPIDLNYFNVNQKSVVTLAPEDSHLSFLGHHLLKVGKALPLVSGNEFASKVLYKTANVSGKKDEQLNLSLFLKCYATQNDILRACVGVYYINVNTKYYYFDFEKNQSSFQLLSRSFVAEDDYSSITVTIEYNGFYELQIASFELYKDSNSIFFDYDRLGNVASLTSSSSGTFSITKNKLSKNRQIKNVDGTLFDFDYGNNGLVSKIKDLYGNYVSYSYDNNQNVSLFSLTSGQTTISTSYLYDSHSNLLWIKENNIIISQYSYDFLYRPCNIQFPNGLTHEVDYDDLNYLIAKEAFDDEDNLIGINEVTYNYQYNKKTRLKGGNLDTFTFTYDDYSRLKKINFPGNNFIEYSYNSFAEDYGRGLPNEKIYDNQKYYFTYNKNNQLIQINFGNDINNSPILTYTYNEEGLISAIYDIQNDIVKFYSYDLKGRLLRYTSSDVVIKYTYDNIGNIQEKRYQINNKNFYIENDYYYENNISSKSCYIKTLSDSFDEIIFAPNEGFGESGAIYKYNGCGTIYDSSLGFDVLRFNDEGDSICYEFVTLNQNRNSGQINGRYFSLGSWQSNFKETKTIYLFFKPSGSLGQGKSINLFKVYSLSQNHFVSMDILSTGKLYLHTNSLDTWPLNNQSIILDGWNFISLSIFTSSYSNIPVMVVNLNGNETNMEYPLNFDTSELTSIVFYRNLAIDVNSLISSSEQYPIFLDMQFSVPLIGFSNQRMTSKMAGQIIDGFTSCMVNATQLIDTNSTHILNNSVFNNFDCFLLNGKFTSLHGIKPSKTVVNNHSLNPIDNTPFKFDHLLKRQVYSKYNDDGHNVLTYPFIFDNQGTVSFWYKLDGTSSSSARTLFTISNNSNYIISLAAGTNCFYLLIPSHQPITVSYSNHLFDVWNHLYFAFTTNSISIRINGVSIYSQSQTLPSIGNTYISLGAIPFDGVSFYDLDGEIESAYISSVCVNFNADFLNSSRPLSAVDYLDGFGRISSKEIITNSSNFQTNYLTSFKNTYSYNRFRPIGETLFSKNSGTPLETFSYVYDYMNNVTSVSINNTVLESYEYDALNRLTKHIHNNGEYEERFTYDNNGNITNYKKYVNNVLCLEHAYSYNNITGYFAVIDQNNNIFYSANNLFRSSSISFGGTNYSLTWQGKRLLNIGSNITYTYNEEGIRIRKVTPNEDTSFILEGKKIIRMIKTITNNPNPFIFDFNYDLTGLLIGLTFNNQEYFYVRDVLGNILGIVNSNGDYIVKYTYTAYGVPTINVIGQYYDALVGTFNPFLYKGYYYDTETGFYYLNTRYYNPEIMRFISGDDPSYLDETTFNGLNIHAYCNNNPIMYADPDGNMCILLVFGISALIGATISLGFQAAEDVIQYSKTGNWNHMNGWKYLTSATGGAIAGLIGGITLAFSLTPLTVAVIAFCAGSVSTGVEMLMENCVGISEHSAADIISSSLTAGAFSCLFSLGSSLVTDIVPSIGALGDEVDDIANAIVKMKLRDKALVGECSKLFRYLSLISATEGVIEFFIGDLLAYFNL